MAKPNALQKISHIAGLVQESINSSASAIELRQSSTKLSM